MATYTFLVLCRHFITKLLVTECPRFQRRLQILNIADVKMAQFVREITEIFNICEV